MELRGVTRVCHLIRSGLVTQLMSPRAAKSILFPPREKAQSEHDNIVLNDLTKAETAMTIGGISTSQPLLAPPANSAATKRLHSDDDDDTDLPPAKKVRSEDAAPKTFLDFSNKLVGQIGTYGNTGELKTTVMEMTPLRLVCHRLDEAIRGASPGFDTAANLSHLSDKVYGHVILNGLFSIMNISVPRIPCRTWIRYSERY